MSLNPIRNDFKLPIQEPFGISDGVLIAASAVILVIVWRRISMSSKP